MSLANKYRPQTFDQMIGQEHIINILKAKMLSRDSVHHNYLLFGPRGTGKTTSARLIAKGLNCLNLQEGNPCNQCKSCELINKGTSLDYVEIDAASYTGVDNIREEIIDKIAYPPTALKKKIYVIDEVHMLSTGAFNALLKTIEEPKDNVCFIFATTEIHKVPETIISRCQVFNFKKVNNPTMTQHLQKICEKEQVQYTLEALNMLSEISEGCVRDAVKYLDQISILGTITEENITKFLGVAGESTIKQFLASLKTKDRIQIFNQLDEIAASGIDLHQFAKQSIHYADKHLLEAIDFYLGVSQVFGKAIELMRRHPYPLIAYKIAVNNYLHTLDNTTKDPIETGNTQLINTTNPQIEKEIKKPIDNQKTEEKATIGNQIPQEPKAEHNNLPKDSNNKETETTNEKTETTTEKTGTTTEEGRGQLVGKTEVQAEGINPEIEESKRNYEANTSETEPTTSPEATISTEEMPSFSTLWENVIKEFNKPMVQSNLKDQAIIENIDQGVVEIIAITKIAEMLLENEENIRIIEHSLSQQLNKKVIIKINFESKDNYFARKMKNNSSQN